MVLDAFFIVGTNLPKAFGEMCNIANETRKNVMLYELAILTDESYFKRTKLMTNSALEKIEQVPGGFLKSNDPALVGAQTITLLKRHVDGNIELEKDRPDIIAYFALYNILLATIDLIRARRRRTQSSLVRRIATTLSIATTTECKSG